MSSEQNSHSPSPDKIDSGENARNPSLEKIYVEASQWVRLVNTIIWTMGTLLVPVSFGFVGLALNTSSGAQFEQRGKIVLGLGSVFLFSFWVYASRIYKNSTHIARRVLINIEAKWNVDSGIVDDGNVDDKNNVDDKRMSFYTMQKSLLERRLGLFPLQIVTLVALVLVWVLIISLKL